MREIFSRGERGERGEELSFSKVFKNETVFSAISASPRESWD